MSPATCVTGSASSHCPGPPSRSWVARAECRSAAAVSITPFGSPVDPEVGTTSATSSRSSGRDGSRAVDDGTAAAAGRQRQQRRPGAVERSGQRRAPGW